MKLKIVGGHNCGKLAILIGLLVGIPLFVLPFYPEEIQYAASFLIPSIASILFGLLICFLAKPSRESNSWRQSMQSGSLTVLFAWFFGIFAGALPFVISGQLPFVGALFEAVSGWTTTGLSVMDISATPHIFLFHRSFMQFCGGLGFIMMIVMLVQEKQSMSLYSAEGHPDKLMPNLKKTARTIFTMYISLLVVGTILYVIFGMELFDSIVHTMCALSTGGFSTKLGSIGEYNSFSIEFITIILMLIGTTNFAVLLLVAKRKWNQVIKVSEIRFMAIIVSTSTILIGISLIFQMNMGVVESFRRALFDGVSALSTTGYSSMAYTNWPPFAIGILILLMLTGGGIGSTAGGLKMMRIYLVCRIILENIRKRLSPARRISAPQYNRAQGRTAIDTSLISDTIGFVASYLAIFTIGSLLLTVTANCSLTDAMFEFSSALGTVGLSIGITGPTTNNATLIVEMAGMLLGRLEIFIVLIGIYSGISIIGQKLKRSKIV